MQNRSLWPLRCPHVVAHPWGGICGGVQGRKQWALVGRQSLFAGIEIRPLISENTIKVLTSHELKSMKWKYFSLKIVCEGS